MSHFFQTNSNRSLENDSFIVITLATFPLYCSVLMYCYAIYYEGMVDTVALNLTLNNEIDENKKETEQTRPPIGKNKKKTKKTSSEVPEF